jgi:hypothetical protein
MSTKNQTSKVVQKQINTHIQSYNSLPAFNNFLLK